MPLDGFQRLQKRITLGLDLEKVFHPLRQVHISCIAVYLKAA